ncbi:hypothetical protein ADUPG1_008037, partial [Aduncisulcus paluster]
MHPQPRKGKRDAHMSEKKTIGHYIPSLYINTQLKRKHRDKTSKSRTLGDDNEKDALPTLYSADMASSTVKMVKGTSVPTKSMYTLPSTKSSHQTKKHRVEHHSDVQKSHKTYEPRQEPRESRYKSRELQRKSSYRKRAVSSPAILHKPSVEYLIVLQRRIEQETRERDEQERQRIIANERREAEERKRLEREALKRHRARQRQIEHQKAEEMRRRHLQSLQSVSKDFGGAHTVIFPPSSDISGSKSGKSGPKTHISAGKAMLSSTLSHKPSQQHSSNTQSHYHTIHGVGGNQERDKKSKKEGHRGSGTSGSSSGGQHAQKNPSYSQPQYSYPSHRHQSHHHEKHATTRHEHRSSSHRKTTKLLEHHRAIAPIGIQGEPIEVV